MEKDPNFEVANMAKIVIDFIRNKVILKIKIYSIFMQMTSSNF